MNRCAPLAIAAMLLAACSETPIEEQGDEAIAEMDVQIEEEALSLEEAADQAVKALAEDIDAELAADGIGAPATAAPAEASDN